MLVQLLRKELRLQIGQVSFALALIALWGLSYGVSITSSDRSELFQIMHYFVVFPGLLFFVPMLMGADSVANERNSGVLERQLSLPVPRSVQWLMKAGATAVLAMAICGGLAALIDWGMAWYLSANQIRLLKMADSWRWSGVTILLFTALGLYASSAARDTLTAFTSALLIVSLSLLLIFVVPYVAKPLLIALTGHYPIWINANYSLLNSNLSRHLFVSAVDPQINRLLFYFRIDLLSFTLVGLGYTNFRLQGFRFWRIALHAIVWISLLIALQILNW